MKPAGGIGFARLGRVVLGATVDVLPMQPVHLRLQQVAPILVFTHPGAADLNLALPIVDLGLEPRHFGAQRPQRLLALDHSGMRLTIPR